MFATTTEDYSFIEESYYNETHQFYDGTDVQPEYSNHHAISRKHEKTIRPDLEKLDFPLDIINTASDIYKAVDPGTKRGKRRRQLIFACVYRAHRELGMAVIPVRLAEVCGIERSDITKALAMIPSDVENSTPAEYIKTHFNTLQKHLRFPDDTLDHLLDMTHIIVENAPDLLDEKPQNVAAAILVFYLKNNGVTINKKMYKEIFGCSDMTLNKLRNPITDAYNR